MEDAQKIIEKLKLELEAEKKKNSILVESTNCAIWEYEIAEKKLVHTKKLNGKYEEWNMTIENYRETMHEWNLVHPEDWDVFDAYCDSMDRGDKHFQYDVRQVTDEALFVWLRYSGETVYDSNNVPVKVVGKTQNVSEEKRNTEALLQLAQRDSLTSLYNKESTGKLVQKYIYNSDSREKGGAFIIVDIDDFKNVNDSFGHVYGDFILKQVANILNSCSSTGDIVGRIGGDEFCMFCKEKRTREEIGEVAQDILDAASEVQLKNGLKLSISMGIALFPEDASDYDDIYYYADVALYDTKANGKHGYSFYKEGMAPLCVNLSNNEKKSTKARIHTVDRRGSNSVKPGNMQSLYMDTILEDNQLAYYVVDPENFKLVETSRKIRHLFPQYEDKEYCYEAVFGRKTPCDDCPVMDCREHKERYSKSLYRADSGKSYEVSVYKFNSEPSEDNCMVSWINTTDWSKNNGIIDSLSGALNYNNFIYISNKAMTRSLTPHALVMLGISGYDRYSKLCGEEKRDDLIKNVAAFFMKDLGKDEYAHRMKDDELFFILDETKQDAKGRIERLIQTFGAIFAEYYAQYSIKLYAGICTLDIGADIPKEAYEKVRKARNIAHRKLSTGNTVWQCNVNEEIAEDI